MAHVAGYLAGEATDLQPVSSAHALPSPPLPVTNRAPKHLNSSLLDAAQPEKE